MSRRHLTLTLAFTLDEDTVRNHDQPYTPNGDTRYSETLDLLRTAIHHQAALILSPFDANVFPPEIEYRGIDYNTRDPNPTDNAL